MFVIDQSQSYKWPVSFTIPTDGGAHKKCSFTAEFKRLPLSRVVEITDNADGKKTDADLVREVMIGWDDVKDADGNAVQFTDAALNSALDIVGFATGVAIAFLESLKGAARKN